MNVPKTYLLIAVLLTFAICSCSTEKKEKTQQNVKVLERGPGTQNLFNGKTLDGWEITNFGTQGPVEAYDGKIVINYGDGASGITWTKDFPKVNYEVILEARKTVGNDFFCGMTFPVNDDFCSFIVGGWGGPVVGLSCIDGLDADDNETRVLKRFDKNVWYKIKLRVTTDRITCCVDNEKLVDFVYTDRKLSIRPEVELSKPFGICTWLTSGEYRNIWLRDLNKSANYE